VTLIMNPATKFDTTRANDYDQQSRIALAGYDACHELTACMLSAALGSTNPVDLLVVGAGTAQEIITIGALQSSWRFTAVDPAPAMAERAEVRLSASGLRNRAELHIGYVSDLPGDRLFDAGTLIGVLHHLAGEAEKRQLLAGIAARLKPGAPFVIACNHHYYASKPLLLAAWRQRWRMQGLADEEVDARLGRILQGADPPASEAAVIELLEAAGFIEPIRFFSSLFWGAWLARRAEGALHVNA
jgi:tRNA (cmo5U34)-methyltransferase